MPRSTSGKSLQNKLSQLWPNVEKKKMIPGQGWVLLDWRCRGNSTVVTVNGGSKDELLSLPFLFSVRPLLLVKQDRFGQTCQDLWYVHWDNFSDHFREADLGGEWLSLDKKVKCKLMELLHRLQQKRHTQAQRQVLNKSYFKLCFGSDAWDVTHEKHEVHPAYPCPLTKRACSKKSWGPELPES